MEYKGIFGIWNKFDKEKVRGVVPAVISNHSRFGLEGVFLAGINNSTYEDMIGVSVSGCRNYSKCQKGLSISGVYNKSYVSQSGICISGGANVSHGSYDKIHKVPGKDSFFRGVAVAPINYADSSKGGVQIGLVNIVKRVTGPTLQIGIMNRCGNSVIPGINIVGVGKYLKDYFSKKHVEVMLGVGSEDGR